MTPEDREEMETLLRRMYLDLYALLRSVSLATGELTGAPPEDFWVTMTHFVLTHQLELQIEGWERFDRQILQRPDDPRD